MAPLLLACTACLMPCVAQPGSSAQPRGHRAAGGVPGLAADLPGSAGLFGGAFGWKCQQQAAGVVPAPGSALGSLSRPVLWFFGRGCGNLSIHPTTLAWEQKFSTAAPQLGAPAPSCKAEAILGCAGDTQDHAGVFWSQWASSPVPSGQHRGVSLKLSPPCASLAGVTRALCCDRSGCGPQATAELGHVPRLCPRVPCWHSPTWQSPSPLPSLAPC